MKKLFLVFLLLVSSLCFGFDKGGYAYVSNPINISNGITYVQGGGSISSIEHATAIFKKTSNGIWEIEYDIVIHTSSTSRTFLSIQIGTLMPLYVNTAATCYSDQLVYVNNCVFSQQSPSLINMITINHGTATTGAYYFQGKAFLASKPSSWIPDGV